MLIICLTLASKCLQRAKSINFNTSHCHNHSFTWGVKYTRRIMHAVLSCLVVPGHQQAQYRLKNLRPAVNIAVNKIDIKRVRYHFHVIAQQLSGHCDVISTQLWRHQQNVDRPRSHGDGVWRSSFLSSFMGTFCRVRNQIMCIFSWQTVYACCFDVYS